MQDLVNFDSYYVQSLNIMPKLYLVSFMLRSRSYFCDNLCGRSSGTLYLAALLRLRIVTKLTIHEELEKSSVKLKKLQKNHESSLLRCFYILSPSYKICSFFGKVFNETLDHKCTPDYHYYSALWKSGFNRQRWFSKNHLIHVIPCL